MIKAFPSRTSLLLKLPLASISVVNAYAQFYYEHDDERHLRRFLKPHFDNFYSAFFHTGFYATSQNAADLLYLVSLSIQIFIYNSFDKKFKMAKLF